MSPSRSGTGPFQQLDGAVDGRPLLVAGDEEGDRSAKIRPALCDKAQSRRHHGGDTALHIDGAPAKKKPVFKDAAKRVMPPQRQVPRRHHVGMSGEDQAGRAGADAGIKVLNVRRARRREDRPLNREARRLQHLAEQRERTTFRRSDGRAADQRLRELDGIVGHLGCASLMRTVA
jgi:hypothetical protein